MKSPKRIHANFDVSVEKLLQIPDEMIDVKELRIGNYINQLGIDYNDDGMKISDHSDLTVVHVTPQIILEIFSFNGADGYVYDPIPITPEWLERLGFGPGLWIYEIVFKPTNAVISYDGENFHVDMKGSYSQESLTLYHIKYVHQLMNLYHAITGHELTINEKI